MDPVGMVVFALIAILVLSAIFIPQIEHRRTKGMKNKE